MRHIAFLSLVLSISACGDVATPLDPGAEPTPTSNAVSYAADVYPAFEARGCTECHSGNGPGRDDGGLMLDSGSNPVHRELTEEESPNWGELRVNLSDGSASLLLRLPLGEAPHSKIFDSTNDPDYELFLAWILEGAQKN